MKKEMRRQDKAISSEEALEILNRAEYGVLATADEDNRPYGVPINFAYSDGVIYFHCATVGHKLENLEKNNAVTLTVVDSVDLLPEKFSTKFESAIAFGTIEIIDDEEEKRKGLMAIVEKLSPQHIEGGVKYINASIGDTKVLKMTVEDITGKAYRG